MNTRIQEYAALVASMARDPDPPVEMLALPDDIRSLVVDAYNAGWSSGVCAMHEALGPFLAEDITNATLAGLGKGSN